MAAYSHPIEHRFMTSMNSSQLSVKDCFSNAMVRYVE